MSDSDDRPIVPRRPKPPPRPEEVLFFPHLTAPPLHLPSPTPPDPVALRRAEAEHLCLWLACSRALCRQSRRCNGPGAACVFEQADVRRPLLEAVVRAG